LTRLRDNANRFSPENPEKVVALYESGVGALGIARRYGVDANTIRKFLKANGVPLRKHRDAINASPLFREAATIAAVKRTEPGVLPVGRGEKELIAMLTERGLELIPQAAIHRYNIDIFAEPVAIEVLGGFNLPWSIPTFSRKVEQLTDRGLNVYGIMLGRCPMTVNVANDIIAYLEQVRADPSRRGEYRMVRGCGKFLAAGRGDFHQLALKRHPRHVVHVRKDIH
jgi:hypothetical protein